MSLVYNTALTPTIVIFPVKVFPLQVIDIGPPPVLDIVIGGDAVMVIFGLNSRRPASVLNVRTFVGLFKTTVELVNDRVKKLHIPKLIVAPAVFEI